MVWNICLNIFKIPSLVLSKRIFSYNSELKKKYRGKYFQIMYIYLILFDYTFIYSHVYTSYIIRIIYKCLKVQFLYNFIFLQYFILYISIHKYIIQINIRNRDKGKVSNVLHLLQKALRIPFMRALSLIARDEKFDKYLDYTGSVIATLATVKS